MPTGVVTLDQFHQRKLMPGELLSVFIHDVKKMLERAMPNIDGETRNRLLLHQLMAGLPSEINKQLRATGETKDLDETIRRSRLLLSLEVQHAATTTVSNDSSELDLKLQSVSKQIETLTSQESALVARKNKDKEEVTCFYCQKTGHMKRYCSKRQQATAKKCFECGRLGHNTKDCRQEGICSWSGQQVIWSPVSPTDVTLVSALVYKLVTVIGELCGTSVQMMMDSGSSVSLITQEIAIKNCSIGNCGAGKAVQVRCD